MTARAGRTYTLLLGIGAAGVLIWIATRVGDYSTWRYWAALGLLWMACLRARPVLDGAEEGDAAAGDQP